ncbi:Protein ImpC (fragment) [Xenorhabdus bovienii str. puntauvense]|uniref:Protein ImpC n=1 Tax=Xenorhabdus bovienii str. puntauvense TaxID=1398201 RepID=A0A077NMT0_XENBV
MVRVGKGSSAEVSISGVDDAEKKAILQQLGDICLSDKGLPS